jgi:hypothetical protein
VPVETTIQTPALEASPVEPDADDDEPELPDAAARKQVVVKKRK